MYGHSIRPHWIRTTRERLIQFGKCSVISIATHRIHTHTHNHSKQQKNIVQSNQWQFSQKYNFYPYILELRRDSMNVCGFFVKNFTYSREVQSYSITYNKLATRTKSFKHRRERRNAIVCRFSMM